MDVKLGAGILKVDVTRADWPLNQLCTFAARNNPRRAFLVVSKVLGRHVAATPAVMRASFRDLAAKIPADLPGPVLVVGLAETAICLGQGVHEELMRQTGRSDLLSIHSTRQQINHEVLCQFEEPHSHASQHIIYAPLDPDLRFAAPRSLVMVDDEISTGTTLTNLANAMIAVKPSIQTVVAVTLADWSVGTDWHLNVARPTTTVSLLSGRLNWVAEATVTAPGVASFDAAARSLGKMDAHRNFGRLGRNDIADECDGLAASLALPPMSRVRIVGTGEFTYPAFRVAEALERAGHDVVVQSTTRSPAHIDGPIAFGLKFTDNYGTGVANYLYNADPGDRRVTIICHETPPDSVDTALIKALSTPTIATQTLYFGNPN